MHFVWDVCGWSIGNLFNWFHVLIERMVRIDKILYAELSDFFTTPAYRE